MWNKKSMMRAGTAIGLSILFGILIFFVISEIKNANAKDIFEKTLVNNITMIEGNNLTYGWAYVKVNSKSSFNTKGDDYSGWVDKITPEALDLESYEIWTAHNETWLEDIDILISNITCSNESKWNAVNTTFDYNFKCVDSSYYKKTTIIKSKIVNDELIGKTIKENYNASYLISNTTFGIKKYTTVLENGSVYAYNGSEDTSYYKNFTKTRNVWFQNNTEKIKDISYSKDSDKYFAIYGSWKEQLKFNYKWRLKILDYTTTFDSWYSGITCEYRMPIVITELNNTALANYPFNVSVNITVAGYTARETRLLASDDVSILSHKWNVSSGTTFTSGKNYTLFGITNGSASSTTTNYLYLCAGAVTDLKNITSYIPNSSVKGYWTFDEMTGATGTVIADNSTNLNNGVINGTLTSVEGVYNSTALYFGANTANFVEIKHSTSLNVGTGDFTLEAVINNTGGGRDAGASQTNYQATYSKRSSDGNEAIWMRVGIDKLQCVLRQGGSQLSSAGTISLADSKFHHIACVRLGDVLTGYVDGKKDGSISGVDTMNPDAVISAIIGKINSAEGYVFNGTIEEVRLTLGALSPSEFAPRAVEPTISAGLLAEQEFNYSLSACANITQAGIYNLTTSITNAVQTCFNITTSDTWIDCQGWNNFIDGSGVAGTTAIKVTSVPTGNLTNITIKNCNSTDWNYGFWLQGGATGTDLISNSSIINSTVNSNTQGITLQSQHSWYENITIYNSAIGIRISSWRHNNNTFKNNSVDIGNTQGVYTTSYSGNSTWIDNTLRSVTNEGVYFDTCGKSPNKMVNNNVTGQTIGMLIEGCQFNEIAQGHIKGITQMFNFQYYDMNPDNNIIYDLNVSGGAINYVASPLNLTFINVTGNPALAADAAKKWYIRFTTYNSSLQAEPSVNLSCYNKTNNIVFSKLSDASGKANANLTEARGSVFASNYTCNISKTGYNTNKTILNITDNNLLLTLNFNQSNIAPIIQNVSITPATAYGNSTLNCSANYGDNDNNQGTINITWYNGSTYYNSSTFANIAAGTLISMNLTQADIAKNEIWNCSVFANDGTDNSALNSTTRTISNFVPVASSVTYTPSSNIYKTTVGLNCTIAYDEIDNRDTITYNYLHHYNNITTGVTTQNITNSSAYFVKNNVMTCQGYVNDGTGNSNKLNSSNITILNSVPILSSNPILSPSSNAYKTTIGINCTDGSYDDADSDALTRQYLWTYNNITTGVTTQNITNSSAYFIKGNTLTCQFSVTDGTDTSVKLNSTNLTILNSAPVLSGLILNPSATIYKTTVGINCSFNSDDADGDAITPKRQWHINNVSSVTTQNITNSTFIKNNNIICMGWATDNTANSTLTNSSQITILNSNPIQAQSGGFIDTSRTIGNSLTLRCENSTDPDEDNLYYEFDYDTSNPPTTVVQNTTAVTKAVTPADGTTNYLRCKATDGSGGTSGFTTIISHTENTAPPLPQAGGFANNSRTIGNSLTLRCENSTDAEGDTVTYAKYFDGSNPSTRLVDNTTAATFVNITADGSAYYFRCKAQDGYETSAFTGVINATENTKPTISLSSPSNDTRQIGNSGTLTASGSDAEGDTIYYEFFYGTTPASVQNTTGNTYAYTSTDGSRYYWWVKVGDGYETNVTSNWTFLENTKPPVTTLISPDDATRTTGNSQNLQWNSVVDAEGDTVTYAVYADTNNPPTTLRQNTTGTSYTLATTDGQVIYWHIKTQDSYETQNSLQRSFTENTPPTLPETGGFTNNSRRTGNSVTLRCENSTDAQADTIVYAMYFDTNSNPTTLVQNTTSTLVQATTDGLIYYYKCKSQDGYETSAFTGIINFTENTAPPQPTLSLPTNNSRVNATTLLTVNSVTDAEGDTVTYSIVGDTSVNPTSLLQNTTATTYNWTLTRGNSYFWRVKAEDTYEASAYSPQFNFTSNSLPVVSQIAVAPVIAYTNDTLNCSANFSDAESDKLNVTFSWYNGSALYSSKTISNILPTNTNYSYLLTAGIQAKNEKWNCSVNAFDGYENGTTVNSSRTISPAIPEITRPTISPASPLDADDLNCSFTASSVDLGKLNASIRWYNGSKWALIKNLNNNYASGSSASMILTNGNTTIGESWTCEGWAVSPSTENSSSWNSTAISIVSSAVSNEGTAGGGNPSFVQYKVDTLCKKVYYFAVSHMEDNGVINYTDKDLSVLSSAILNETGRVIDLYLIKYYLNNFDIVCRDYNLTMPKVKQEIPIEKNISQDESQMPLEIRGYFILPFTEDIRLTMNSSIMLPVKINIGQNRIVIGVLKPFFALEWGDELAGADAYLIGIRWYVVIILAVAIIFFIYRHIRRLKLKKEY